MGYIVVLDPGHGGEEFKGGEFGPYIEKDLDLTLAKAMRDRLSMYDDVTVYLTRETDIPVELADRATIAKAYNANLFISLHFNLSSPHDVYGAEVWLPAQRDYYNQLYPLASLMMSNFESLGLYNRGIKTKLGKSGDNYYAVIKGPVNYGIPAMIVEHCHMDNANDNWIIPATSNDALTASLNNFAVLDADAVAKSLHLKSTALGLDYSNYVLPVSNRTESMIMPDTTAPENNIIEVKDINSESGKVTVSMHATDSDGYVQYYKYSIDGGVTYTPLYSWPRSSRWDVSQPTYEFSIDAPKNKKFDLVTVAVNNFDLPKESNVVHVDMKAVVKNEDGSKTDEDESETGEESETTEESEEDSMEDLENEETTENSDENSEENSEEINEDSEEDSNTEVLTNSTEESNENSTGEFDEDSVVESADALKENVNVEDNKSDIEKSDSEINEDISGMTLVNEGLLGGKGNEGTSVLIAIVALLFIAFFITLFWTFSNRKVRLKTSKKRKNRKNSRVTGYLEDSKLRDWDDYDEEDN